MLRKMKKVLIGIFSLLAILQPAVVWAQEGDANSYIISYNKTLYTFEVIKNPNLFTLKCKSGAVKKGGADSCNIPSVYDINSLAIAIKKVNLDINKDTAALNCASMLLAAYNSRENTAKLESTIKSLMDDKTTNILTLTFKKSPIVGYLIPRKSADRKNFQPNKSITYCTKTNEIKHLDSIKSFRDYRRLMRKSPEFLKRIKKTAPVDSVGIAIENGVIKDIHVMAHKGTDSYYFTNWKYISTRNGQDIDALSSKDRNYLPFLLSRDSIFIVDLADIIDFNRRVAFTSGTYTINDTTLTVSKKKGMVQVYKPKLDEAFDIKVFSDFLGFNHQNPNGIIQAEISYNFSLIQGKKLNSVHRIWRKTNNNNSKLRYRNQWVCFNRISPYIKLSKVEKTNKVLSIDSLSEQGRLIDIFRYSYLNFGTDLNLVTYRTDSKRFTLNLAGGVILTKVGNDTIETKNIQRSTFYINPNSTFKFFDSNKIDFDMHFGMYGAWLVSPFSPSDLTKIGVKKYVFDITHWWGEFQLNISLHPNGNKQKSVFLRAAEYISSMRSYSTVQIGYASTLSNLL
ncbi:MAG: hypothetical protein HXX16_14665 [Bacteroidales bacterium]|nr:hypothetical protein [Bacteroidales bacterium]